MTNDRNEKAAHNWANSIQWALARKPSDDPVTVRNRRLPHFRLYALTDVVPLPDCYERIGDIHRPVLAHLVIEELARRGIAAHLFKPPLNYAGNWVRVQLCTVDAEISYQGYDTASEEGATYGISPTIDLVIARDGLPPE